MKNSLAQHIFFFLLLVGAGILMYYILAPFLVPILLAIVFSVFFSPVHNWMLEKTGRRNLSAFLTTLIVVLAIIVPFVIVGFFVFIEARDLYIYFSSDAGIQFLQNSLIRFENLLGAYAPNIQLDLAGYARGFLAWLIQNTSVIFTGALTIALDTFLLLVALFYLFRDGKALKQYAIELSPLDTEDDEDIFSKATLTINSVIRGTLIIAVVQGVLAAIGFTIFGIGNPALWGVVTALTALIPGVGTALVNFPVIVYLLVTGDYVAGIGYIVWSAALIGMVDNILAPMLIERKVKVHPFMILLSVLGGLIFFGPIGFLAGPIILVVAMELLKLYPKFAASNPVQVPVVNTHDER